MAKKKSLDKLAAAPIKTFQAALAMAGERPSDLAGRDEKKNYSERLSNALSVLIAHKLRTAEKKFKGILPRPDGGGRESPSASGASKKHKKVDVHYATERTGLELLVSIKTLNFRDLRKKNKKPLLNADGSPSLARYTKNMVRNDHELRAEAEDHHERFPYAVLIAVFFLPHDACNDASGRPADVSSFGHAVRTLRSRAGRRDALGPKAKFERVFIGLYGRPGGEGDVAFFDVMDAPPRKGSPPWPGEPEDPRRGNVLLSLDELIEEICREYGIRNRSYIDWADG
jgi:hypothetical protein